MTETEWLVCSEPPLMLDFLKSLAKVSADRLAMGRKCRLFMVACCNRQLHLLSDDRSRRALCVAEMHALRKISRQDLKLAEQAARAAARELRDTKGYFAAVAASVAVTLIRPVVAAEQASWFAASDTGSWDGRMQELASHADLLREIFGNPFRPIVADPKWLAWRNGTVVKLAQEIQDRHQFDLLPVLGDALEEAGCDNEELIKHCRAPGGHVPGCWLLDIFSGKSKGREN